MKRTVFFVSDSTGITAEKLGHSLLSQFDGVDFDQVYMPHINTRARATELTGRLQEAFERDGVRPVVFATLLDHGIAAILKAGNCFYMELFEGFIAPLADELGVRPSLKAGRSHAITRQSSYARRIEAINFAMANDDGVRPDNFHYADLVLVGVSRSGKTPTCLYLSMNFGLRAANYPITDEDLGRDDLPREVWDCRSKVFALTIDAERLHRIREERRPGSGYASIERCRRELHAAAELFQRLEVPVLNTTSLSIEEIASHLLRRVKPPRL